MRAMKNEWHLVGIHEGLGKLFHTIQHRFPHPNGPVENTRILAHHDASSQKSSKASAKETRTESWKDKHGMGRKGSIQSQLQQQ